MCPENIMEIFAKLTALGLAEQFDNTFWILRRRLQRYQIHIGPTSHVGPKYMIVNSDVFQSSLSLNVNSDVYIIQF